MVHFDNFENILKQGALLSKTRLETEKTDFRSIANEEVQNFRDRIFLRDFSTKTYRPLHDYVPFYFATHTPMLWNKYTEGIQNEIIILAISRTILKVQGVLFTDGNASNQQLSKFGKEKVGIVPAIPSNPNCYREYRILKIKLSIPPGTNPDRSNFYGDTVFLSELNWEVINDRWSKHPNKTRLRHAEVLVPDSVPLNWIKGIFVNTQSMINAVNGLIIKYHLNRLLPAATYKPDLFF